MKHERRDPRSQYAYRVLTSEARACRQQGHCVPIRHRAQTRGAVGRALRKPWPLGRIQKSLVSPLISQSP